MATTADDVWQLLAELATAQKETDRQLQETSREIKELNRELTQQLKEQGKQLKEQGKQIGGLGAKFGSFTEGLALPSMETILRERFGMEIISPSVRASKQGQHRSIDVLAYANGSINTAYIVEVKSHAREDSITQLKNILQRFRFFFPEHKDKQLYGIGSPLFCVITHAYGLMESFHSNPFAVIFSRLVISMTHFPHS